MKLHQVVVIEKGCVLSRVLSCFCGNNCTCFDPVTTVFVDEVRLQDNQPGPSGKNANVQDVDKETSARLDKVNLVDESLVGKYAVVMYDGLPFPGIIMSVDEDEIEVKVMHRVGVNRYFWPLEDGRRALVQFRQTTDVIAHRARKCNTLDTARYRHQYGN